VLLNRTVLFVANTVDGGEVVQRERVGYMRLVEDIMHPDAAGDEAQASMLLRQPLLQQTRYDPVLEPPVQAPNTVL